MGALAEIAMRLDVSGPKALAAILRDNARAEPAVQIINACLSPPSGAGSMTPDDAPIATAICAVFESAFSALDDADDDDAWPFDAWLKMAVLQFGLSPHEFWRTSLRDWRVLTASPKTAAMARADFNVLRRAFPDIDEKRSP